MKHKLTFALVVLMTSTAFAAFQAPLPEFKNEKQLAEWRAKKATEATKQGYIAEEAAFYTGKPYLASSRGYAFKYRAYNPDLARWTSEDPSGFPDGANASIYAPNPASELDADGLAIVKIVEYYHAEIPGYWSGGLGTTRHQGFLAFQNSISQTYYVGAALTAGQVFMVQTKDLLNPRLIGSTKVVESVTFEDVLVNHYPNSTFKAFISSKETFHYE